MYYDFELDGGRSNQLLTLVNNTGTAQTIQAVSFATNAEIDNPWQIFGQQWSNVSVTQQGNFYIYTLPLNPAVTLQLGNNPVLEYSVTNALGPITNVAMPPAIVGIQYQGNPNWQTLTPIGASSPQANPLPNTEFTMYHAGWGQYGYQRNMSTEFWSSINSLTYAFIGFDQSGNVFSLDTWGDQLELPSLSVDKQALPYLKSSISFGGWSNNGAPMAPVFSAMAADPTARANFVTNAVNAVIQAGVNGIDIDWEYPTAADANNYITLLQELRTALTNAKIPNARLTIAAPAGSDNIGIFTSAQWQTIANTVDRMNVMCYDYFGAFSDCADFHSPWALSPNSPHKNSSYCVQDTLAIYQALGVDSSKISMGIPNYSRSMIVAEAGDYAGLYQQVIGAPQGDFPGANGVYSWNTLNLFLNKQPSALDALGVSQWYYYDSRHPLCVDAGMCLLSGQLPNGQWVVINFLDPSSAQVRSQQANTLKLGGVMEWANYFDTLAPASSITQAITNGVSNQNQLHLNTQKSPTIHQKTDIDKAVSQHTNNLRKAFFSKEKSAVLNLLLSANNANEMRTIINNNQKTLGKHRNIFKRAICSLFPTSITNRLFNPPKSLMLAKKLLAKHMPTLIILKPSTDTTTQMHSSYQRFYTVTPSAPPMDNPHNAFAPSALPTEPPPSYSEHQHARFMQYSQQTIWHQPTQAAYQASQIPIPSAPPMDSPPPYH